MRVLTRAALLAVLFLGTMAGFHPAAAQAPAPCRDNGTTSPYAGAKAGLAADKNAAAVGEQVQLSGCGYRPNSTVGLTMHSHTMNLGTVTANANGEFTFTFPVPPDAEVGAHTITATGVDPAGVNRVQNLSFTVTAAQVATTTTLATTAATTASTTRVAGTSTTLPATGSGSTVPSVAGGIALVGVGTGLVIAARRRRQRASTASA